MMGMPTELSRLCRAWEAELMTGWDKAGRGAPAAPYLGPEVAGPLSKSGPAIEKEWFLHGENSPQMQGCKRTHYRPLRLTQLLLSSGLSLAQPSEFWLPVYLAGDSGTVCLGILYGKREGHGTN